MKKIYQSLQALCQELDSLNKSWIPSEEIEQLYSPKLAKALQHFSMTDKKLIDFDNFPLILSILEEISNIDYKGELKCCTKLIEFKSSTILNIYEAFKLFEIDFAIFYHHKERENIIKLYKILLENRAFSERLTHLLLNNNAIPLFIRIVELLYKYHAEVCLKNFIGLNKLDDLEQILTIFEAYDSLDILTSENIRYISEMVIHNNLVELHHAVKKAYTEGVQTKNDLLLLSSSSQPLKMIDALHFLDKHKLREDKIVLALIEQKEPQKYVELVKFLAEQELLTAVFFEKLSEMDILHLYHNYFQNNALSSEEKHKRIFQFLSYYEQTKQEFNASILSLVKFIQIKTLYIENLSDKHVQTKTLESFTSSMILKLSLDLIDYKVCDVIECLKRLIQKDYDFFDKFSETSLKESLVIISRHYIDHPKNQAVFISYFKKYFYNIQNGTPENRPLSIADTFIKLVELSLLLHQDMFKKVEYNPLNLFEALILSVEMSLKSYCASLFTALPKKQCLELLYIFHESGIPQQIWALLEPNIFENLSSHFPNEQNLRTIVKLGQGALPPMQEINEMFVNHFIRKEPGLSFFNPQNNPYVKQESLMTTLKK